MGKMNKTALITGVSGGIGRATAEVFLENGWEVIGIDKLEMDEPGKVHFIKGDISDVRASEMAFNKAAETVEKIDALINIAAVLICKPVTEMNVDEWDSVMASNLRSVYLAVHQVYRFMRRPGGAIVNVSSVHAVATSANIAAYAASKGAVLALTRALAVELAGEGIRVNAVLPGAVDTQMLRDGLSRGHVRGADVNEKLELLGRRIPLRRVGQPEEIAQSILFLSDSSCSSYITGEALAVDGGALARLSTE